MPKKCQTRVKLMTSFQLRTIAKLFLLTAVIAYVFSSALLLVGAYAVIVCVLLARAQEGKPIIPETPLNIPLMLIIGSLLISIAANGNWHEGVKGLHKWLRAILFFWASYDLLQTSHMQRKVGTALTIGFFIATADGLLQYFIGKDIIRGYEIGYVNSLIRVTSSFGYFGLFAIFLLVSMPLVMNRVAQIQQPMVQRILTGLAMVLGLVCLYLTRTRGAWLAAVGMLIIYFLLQRKRWMMILLVLGLITAPFVLPADLVFHSKKSTGIDKTIGHRLVLWRQAINVIKAKPIAGCGLNTYVQNIEKYNPSQDSYEVKNYYAHNGYLQHTAETGLVGILAFLFLIFRFYARVIPELIRRKPDFHDTNLMVFLSITGYLFYMFFDTIFHNLAPFVILWLLLSWGLLTVPAKIRSS